MVWPCSACVSAVVESWFIANEFEQAAGCRSAACFVRCAARRQFGIAPSRGEATSVGPSAVPTGVSSLAAVYISRGYLVQFVDCVSNACNALMARSTPYVTTWQSIRRQALAIFTGCNASEPSESLKRFDSLSLLRESSRPRQEPLVFFCSDQCCTKNRQVTRTRRIPIAKGSRTE